jgi:hypothetical protein
VVSQDLPEDRLGLLRVTAAGGVWPRRDGVVAMSDDRAASAPGREAGAQHGGRLQLPEVRNGALAGRRRGNRMPRQGARGGLRCTARPYLLGVCIYRERSKDLISLVILLQDL